MNRRSESFGVLKRKLQLFLGEIVFVLEYRQALHAGSESGSYAAALQNANFAIRR
jgi:hypothetical protein